MTPKIKAEFHFRAFCSWILKSSCPVMFPIDFPWDLAVTRTVTTSLRHSSYWVPIAFRTRCPSATMAYGAPCEPVPANCPDHAVPFFFHLVPLVIIFSPFLACMSTSPSSSFHPNFFPSHVFLFCPHSSGLSLTAAMQRAFHKPPQTWFLKVRVVSR